MANIVLFHHAQGLTDGLKRMAAAFERAGHTVFAPDLYEGKTFPTVDDGVAFAESTGFDVINARADAALAAAPHSTAPHPRVYMGFSMGAESAARHAQADPQTAGLILMHAAIDPAWMPSPWPAGLPIQVHACDQDPWMEFDALAALRTETEKSRPVEVYLYPGETHLFTDDSVPEYNAVYAQLARTRLLRFLEEVS